MSKKLSKTAKISLSLFGTLTGVGILGTTTYFWIQSQSQSKPNIIDQNQNTPDQSIEENKPSFIPYEYPEFVDNHKVMNNELTKRTRFSLHELIDKKEIIKQIVDYGNYINNFENQELSFNENKLKTKLINIFKNCLLKSNACKNKLENIEIYYQLINTKNVSDFRYNQLNIYIKWKCQESNSFISKEYYDLISLTL